MLGIAILMFKVYLHTLYEMSFSLELGLLEEGNGYFLSPPYFTSFTVTFTRCWGLTKQRLSQDGTWEEQFSSLIPFPFGLFSQHCCCSVTKSCLSLLWPHQAPLSMGFLRLEYQSGLPFPSPVDLPNPGIEPMALALQVDSLPSEPSGKPLTAEPSLKLTL